jgi:predicted SAM-dependent methyltransferase
MKLSIGAGHFDEYFRDWISIDAKSALAKEYPAGSFRCMDARNLLKEFKPKSFDVVFSEHFFEHLNMRDSATIVAAAHSLLKDGGVIRVSVPDAILRRNEQPERFPEQHSHLTAWTVFSLEWLLKNAGFKTHVVAAWLPDGTRTEDLDRLKMDYGLLRRMNSLVVDGVK